MKIAEHGVVALNRDLPEYNLQAGDVGAVVHVYAEQTAFEVEFVSGGGRTIAVATLAGDDVRPLGDEEILHVRSVVAAERASIRRFVRHGS